MLCTKSSCSMMSMTRGAEEVTKRACLLTRSSAKPRAQSLLQLQVQKATRILFSVLSLITLYSCA